MTDQARMRRRHFWVPPVEMHLLCGSSAKFVLIFRQISIAFSGAVLL